MMLRRSSKAFTMIEIMVVTVLIMGILALVGPKIVRYITQAGQKAIQFKTAAIKEALSEYKLTFGVFPSSKEGLRALIQNPNPNNEIFKRNADKWPFVKEDTITDKAGNEFVYHCPPEQFKGKYKYYEILYLGPTQSEDDPERLDDGI